MIKDLKQLWKTEKKKVTSRINLKTMKDTNTEIGILRFTTAGSVDDGKSTLIGRLLYDSKSIFEDQMEHITESSKRRGNGEVDLALLTDGLRAEREQGITIDVAYRYFSTPKRKFIIADTPGHIQYTRNMVTGASTADVAVILVDARNGVIEQTTRHTFIASLLNMKHIIFCVNKMDLVDYSEETYNQIKKDIEKLADNVDVKNIHIIPISAKLGDNVVENTDNLSWFKGSSFLDLLETVELAETDNLSTARFPVQSVIRPQTEEFPDFRAYGGRIAGGTFTYGESVTILPSMLTSKIKSIHKFEQTLNEAKSGESVCICLEDEIDISRGNMIVPSSNIPNVTKEVNIMMCWFNEKALMIRGKYILRTSSTEVKCMITAVNGKLNINTLEEDKEDKQINMNDISNVSIKCTQPIFTDSYKLNSVSGSMILIDEATNETVAAGMVI
jgi:sulfate adenylyltransferase subunit 1